MFPASTTSTELGSGYLPLTLKLSGRSCLVVGGGPVAARKAKALLAGGAQVTVVSPDSSAELRVLLADSEQSLSWECRPFRASDAAGRFLLIAATDDRQVNRQVADAARERRVLANVVDDPEVSDFLMPAVLERGPLQVAVSTSGQAPALAAALRRKLTELFPAEWAEVVQLFGNARGAAFQAGLAPAARRKLNLDLACLPIDALLETGGIPAVRRAMGEVLERRGLGGRGPAELEESDGESSVASGEARTKP